MPPLTSSKRLRQQAETLGIILRDDRIAPLADSSPIIVTGSGVILLGQLRDLYLLLLEAGDRLEPAQGNAGGVATPQRATSVDPR